MNITYKQEYSHISVFIVGIIACMLPFMASAAVGIPCNGPECNFDHLIQLANNIIKFLMFKVAVPLAAIGLMWTGGNLIINQNKEGAWNEAKSGFSSIAIGFLIMLSAYLVIKTILYAFLRTDAGFTLFLFQ
jgi:hypothetical protein